MVPNRWCHISHLVSYFHVFSNKNLAENMEWHKLSWIWIEMITSFCLSIKNTRLDECTIEKISDFGHTHDDDNNYQCNYFDLRYRYHCVSIVDLFCACHCQVNWLWMATKSIHINFSFSFSTTLFWLIRNVIKCNRHKFYCQIRMMMVLYMFH